MLLAMPKASLASTELQIQNYTRFVNTRGQLQAIWGDLGVLGVCTFPT